MRRTRLLTGCLLLLCLNLAAEAQRGRAPKGEKQNVAAAEEEVKKFFDSYAEDLRLQRGDALTNRYDPRGYYSVGNGSKRLISIDEVKERYQARWPQQMSFAWRDLSVEVLSPDTAAVTALFTWQARSGEVLTNSYTGLLTKRSGRWLIRLEDESPAALTTVARVSGNTLEAGPFKYLLTAQPGASAAAQRHSVDLRITVRRGRKYVLMGDLMSARVQQFEAGSTFVIPAGTWYVEWWETETVEEVEGVGPMRTERASPSTPRTP